MENKTEDNKEEQKQSEQKQEKLFNPNTDEIVQASMEFINRTFDEKNCKAIVLVLRPDNQANCLMHGKMTVVEALGLLNFGRIINENYLGNKQAFDLMVQSMEKRPDLVERFTNLMHSKHN